MRQLAERITLRHLYKGTYMAPAKRRRFRLVVLAAASMTILGASVWASLGWLAQRERYRTNLAVFDTVAKTVGRKYVDQHFNDFDWQAVVRRQREMLEHGLSPDEMYWSALRPMLSLLESSHTSVMPPRLVSRRQGTAPTMEVIEPSMGRCIGLWLTSGREMIRPRVITVHAGSSAATAGVQEGWRLLTIKAVTSGKQLRTEWLDRTGADRTIMLPVPRGAIASGSTTSGTAEELNAAIWGGGNASATIDLPLIGVEVRSGANAGQIAAAEIDPGSPAARAGILPGYTLLSISSTNKNDELVTEGSLASPGGKIIKFRAAKVCSERDFEPIISIKRRTEGEAIFRFDRFDEEGLRRFNELIDENPSKLILDLRHNSGGSLEVLRKMLGTFLRPGTEIGTLRRATSSTPVRAARNGRSFTGPVAIVTGLMTASSGEVLTEALQHAGRAKVFGRKTAGETELSYRYLLPDGGQLQVAEESYYTKAGRRIERSGVVPDQLVTLNSDDLTKGTDTDLKLAAAWLQEASGLRTN